MFNILSNYKIIKRVENKILKTNTKNPRAKL